MTDSTSATVAGLAAGTKSATIPAYRFLAFLDLERRWLVHELFPGRKPGEMFFVACDAQVDAVCCGQSPLDRAERVLRALEIDPHADDAWVDSLGTMPLTMAPPKKPQRR